MHGRSHSPQRRAWSGALTAALLFGLAAASLAQTDPAELDRDARKAIAEGRFADAADHYAKLVASNPDEPSAQANLGIALHMSGKHAEALEPLRKAAAGMPSSFQVNLLLGAALASLQEFADAVAPLRQAVGIDPNNLRARALLAESLEAAGDLPGAAESWRAIRELNRINPAAHAGLVRCHEQMAAMAAAELRHRDPESEYVLRLIGHARMEAAQYPSALYLFREALKRNPENRSAREAIAEIYDKTGKPEWATAERERASSLPQVQCPSPDAPECDFLAGRFGQLATVSGESSSEVLYWAAKANARLAEASFSDLAALDESPGQLKLLTAILVSQGRFTRAAETCRRVLDLSPEDEFVQRELAELLYRSRRFDEARPMLVKFLASDQSDPRWAAMLGSILAEEHNYETAAKLLETALALPGAPPSVRIDLGRVYLALDRPADAADVLAAALDIDIDGSVHYQLAQAYLRLGQNEPALKALEQYRVLEARSRQRRQDSAALEITPPE